VCKEGARPVASRVKGAIIKRNGKVDKPDPK